MIRLRKLRSWVYRLNLWTTRIRCLSGEILLIVRLIRWRGYLGDVDTLRVFIMARYIRLEGLTCTIGRGKLESVMLKLWCLIRYSKLWMSWRRRGSVFSQGRTIHVQSSVSQLFVEFIDYDLFRGLDDRVWRSILEWVDYKRHDKLWSRIQRLVKDDNQK